MALATPTSFGFSSLLEMFTVNVQRAENRPLNVHLTAPFTIVTSRLKMVENVAVRVELSNGCMGWGETPILPFMTAEDQHTTMVKAKEACEFLLRSLAMTLGSVLGEIGRILHMHDRQKEMKRKRKSKSKSASAVP
ncbi:hypothetical protein EV2_031312 [Malus domestica]